MERYQNLQAKNQFFTQQPQIGNMKQPRTFYPDPQLTENEGKFILYKILEPIGNLEKDYLNRYPLTHSEVSEVIQKRMDSSGTATHSQFERESVGARTTNTVMNQNQNIYDPSQDFVSRAELKYLFEKMMKEKNVTNQSENTINVRSLRHIGELSKAIIVSQSKSKKKSKKWTKPQNVFAHLQVKQDTDTKEIKVYVRDIVARRFVFEFYIYRDYEVLVSPVLLPLSDQDLMKYIDKALKVQYDRGILLLTIYFRFQTQLLL